MNGNKVDNTQNFERCNQFLKASGTLYIAPEGTSLLVRRLLPLKTGAARIALQAEASADFKLGLQLIPAGITYVDQGEFRSKYLMEVGEAFSISSFKEQYQTDPKAAVISLTDLIQNKMQQLVIQLDNDEHIELFEYLIRAFNKDIEAEPYKFYVEGKILAIRLNYLNDYASDKLNIVNREFEELKQIVSKLKLRSYDIPEVLSPWSVGDWIQNFLISIIYLPLFLGGLTFHLLANLIPWSIEKLLGLHIIYKSTVKMLSGLMIYPVIYSIQLYLLWHYFHDIEKIIIYIISFVISGLMFFPLLRLYRKLFLHIKVISKQNEDYNLLRNKILTLKDLINK
jgi:hypothetical protein